MLFLRVTHMSILRILMCVRKPRVCVDAHSAYSSFYDKALRLLHVSL